MKFESKFSCGDKVFRYERRNKDKRENCPKCGGKGKLICCDESEQWCYYCHSSGHIVLKRWYEYFVCDNLLTIGQIRFQYTDCCGEKNTKEEYMCIETGVGSGTIYSVDRLFTTKEEAQLECDRLNKELIEENNVSNDDS